VPNEEAIENYLQSFNLAHSVADYIAVNVSSPNTPNLRELQKAENLEELLLALQNRNRELSAKPLLVKIAPDLSEAEIEAIVDVAEKIGISGIIATNTTVERKNLLTKIDENGGLSGKPLREKSTEVVAVIYRYSNGKLPIIGVGGIFDAQDAFDKIAAGACLIQSYTGFVYQGFSFARDVNKGLSEILKQKGFNHLDEAVGCQNKY
jgi:dihydroorotate dehydrogenase